MILNRVLDGSSRPIDKTTTNDVWQGSYSCLRVRFQLKVEQHSSLTVKPGYQPSIFNHHYASTQSRVSRGSVVGTLQIRALLGLDNRSRGDSPSLMLLLRVSNKPAS